jgi:hypothetical protein
MQNQHIIKRRCLGYSTNNAQRPVTAPQTAALLSYQTPTNKSKLKRKIEISNRHPVPKGRKSETITTNLKRCERIVINCQCRFILQKICLMILFNQLSFLSADDGR